jgi:hypothetical protein
MAPDRLATLAARIAAVRELVVTHPEDDSVREAYGELCDLHRGDAEALALLKPLGDDIRRLEAEGVLPSALVARSPRRKS